MEKLTLSSIPSQIELPICDDLYCGLGGWAEGFLSEGFHVRGYDIEKHDYGTGTYPGELILCDVRSIHGSQCKDAAVIVASPPCQEPSYRAMPWKRAKALNEIGPPHNFIELFNACFRIQREASEAAGHYIPLIVENVRGAERWVGSARWHFGSYYLWGDVPALMPPTLRGLKFNPDGTNHPADSWFAIADSVNRGTKSPGTRLSEVGFNVRNAQRFREGLKMGWDNSERGKLRRDDGCKVPGIGHRPTGRWTNPAENGVKCGGSWVGKGNNQSLMRNYSSKSDSRKAASAEIAKIPFPLAQWIARCYKPSRITKVSA
jgi:hypothetical protein